MTIHRFDLGYPSMLVRQRLRRNVRQLNRDLCAGLKLRFSGPCWRPRGYLFGPTYPAIVALGQAKTEGRLIPRTVSLAAVVLPLLSAPVLAEVDGGAYGRAVGGNASVGPSNNDYWSTRQQMLGGGAGGAHHWGSQWADIGQAISRALSGWAGPFGVSPSTAESISYMQRGLEGATMSGGGIGGTSGMDPDSRGSGVSW